MGHKGEPSLGLGLQLFTAGTAACIADIATFPLDTAKVRLQIQGESVLVGSRYNGMFGTMITIARQEGTRSLYNGLVPGLQRQMAFASIRIGLYEPVKMFYQRSLFGETSSDDVYFSVRVAAGMSTGALAVMVAQPTDVVKVRFQAQKGGTRYTSTLQAYRAIALNEGMKGLWKGLGPNIGRNVIVNVSEIVCYDAIKSFFIKRKIMGDNILCHFTSAVFAGLCTTFAASPVDVVKTRYMNSPTGKYRSAVDCAVKMIVNEGPKACYKGFTPSFCRLVSWNIAMWITYEQLKRIVTRLSES